jgi:HD superfamily phosphohydrolase
MKKMTNIRGLKKIIEVLLNESEAERSSLLKEDQNVFKSFIRHCINEVYQEVESVNDKISILRETVQGMLKEAEATGGSPDAPSDITAINFLKNLLKNIIPSVEESYKELTSSKKQRASFRKHILNATENLLNSLDANPESLEGELDELKVKVADEEGDDTPEGFIDIYDGEKDSKEDKSKDPEEEFASGLETMDLDKTGRNSAFETFKRIQNQIENEYSKLDPDANVEGRSETEREIFRDYLLLNMKLYFDTFEEDLSVAPEEPETPAEDEYISKMAGDDDKELIPPEEAGL